MGQPVALTSDKAMSRLSARMQRSSPGQARYESSDRPPVRFALVAAFAPGSGGIAAGEDAPKLYVATEDSASRPHPAIRYPRFDDAMAPINSQL